MYTPSDRERIFPSSEFDRHLLRTGTIKFKDKATDCPIASRPFIYVDEDIDLERIYKMMTNDRKELKAVNLVVSVLNSISNHKPFKTLKISETLRDGIQNIVNNSKVWFIANGIDVGLPQLIGAVVQETIALRAEDVSCEKNDSSSKKWHALTFLGIVSDQSIKQIANGLKTNATLIEISVDKRNKYSLNSDHTHFIIVREKAIPATLSDDIENNSSIAECDENLIDSATSSANQFRDRFEQFLRQPKNPSVVLSTDAFPLVYIFVRGTSETIEMLHHKIEQNLPIIIIKGSGSAAEMIVLAYDTINTKNNKTYDAVKLKRDLNRSLLDEYPTLNTQMLKRYKIRDDIISIAKENELSKVKLINFIDITSSILSANEIHKTILSAYLKSERVIVGNESNVLMQQNTLLELTLDWGLIDIVQSEIFEREDFLGYIIPERLFKQALLGDNREPFVDLFLQRGFSLHRYLKSNELRHLFDRQKDRDFFITTSLEGILGWNGDDNQVPPCFIGHAFIDIIKRLTNIKIDFDHEFQSEDRLNEIPTQTFHYRQIHAETKAIRYLVICAVLTNRHSLVKILWKRTSEPILLALICSMMLKRLTSYCREPYQKALVNKQEKEYTDYAIGVLDKSFKEDEIQTFRMLFYKHSDLNDMNVIQLAYNWNNKEFLSHAFLQKWITRRFYGKITPREFSWGFYTCPDSFKIILSALLVFPMSFWISFSPIGADQSIVDEREPSQSDEELKDQSLISNKKDCQHCRNQKKDRKEMKRNVFRRIEILWDAPITKFYADLVTYLLFLIIFTLAVMWPSCGNLVLDWIVWFWTASIAIENIRITYLKYRSQRDLPIRWVSLGILIQITFLLSFLLVRIIGLRCFGTGQIVISKAILGVGLIFYFYRLLFIYLPISSKFGPMMIRLRYMICDDFVTFLRLFAIFMISSGVAITAVLYPHHPLDWNLFSKAILFRGLMALFTSEMFDLKNSYGTCTVNATTIAEKKSVCSALSHSYRYDNSSVYERYGISSPFCRQTSWIAWLLLIQYFFLAKRFLISLLTAMFSVTGARVQQQSEQIWCYNLYAILVEYQNRLRLPPPFIIISYIIELIKIVCHQCRSILCFGRCFQKRNITKEASPSHTANDTDIFTELLLSTSNGSYSNTKQLNDTSLQVEKTTHDQKVEETNKPSIYWKCKAKEYFLQNQAMETAKDQSKGIVNVQKDIDVLRRSMLQSKERIVTLEEMINHSNVLLEQICPIILREDRTLMTDNQTKFVHIYSRQSPYVYTNDARFPVAEKFIPWEIPEEVYRPTLITLSKEHSCFSENERSFVESHWNPVGRTGVQGRGALVCWGANKSILALITRWKRVDKKSVLVQGKPLLETILFIDQNTHNCKFPEGKVLGEQSPYSAVCRFFNEFIFEDKIRECSSSFQKQNMIEYFESFARSNEVESHIISRGYIDDVRNTDNAWIEAEIWNFHYDSIVAFPPLRNDGTVFWESLTDNLSRVSIQTPILRKLARIHDAYFD